MNNSSGSANGPRSFYDSGNEASSGTSYPGPGGWKRRHEDVVSSSSKLFARIGASVSLTTLDDDDEPTTDTSAVASEWVISRPKYMQLKAELAGKVRENEDLQKKVEEGKIKFNCMWEKAVELEKSKEAMQREIAELKRKKDTPSEVADLTEELRNQRQEAQRLQREVDDLRKEGDSRRSRISELEQRLANATKKATNCPTTTNRPSDRKQRMTTSVAHAETEQPEDRDLNPRIQALGPGPPSGTHVKARRAGAVAAVHNLQFVGGARKTLTRSSIVLVKSLGCPVLDDTRAPSKSQPWERAEWFLANTPTAAFTWLVENCTGKAPLISNVFCPCCYSVLKLRSGSVARSVRLHYESAHSLPRKCTYERCRRRWTKSMATSAWCFKYTQSNELLLDCVRCEQHSTKCAVDRCKNRWYEGLPDSEEWDVRRNADGSVNARGLKCPDHA